MSAGIVRSAARIERASGRPATTTTTTVLDALRAVGATSLAVATPYLEELNAIERQFLEASGFAVASISGLGCATDAEIGRLDPADAVSLVERVDTPEADAVFISCTNFHCLPAIASLERQVGKPVVTSNLAGAWAALRQIGIADTDPWLRPAAPPPGSRGGHGAMTSETASVDEDASPAETNRLGEGQSYLIGDTIYLRGAESATPNGRPPGDRDRSRSPPKKRKSS